MYINEKQLVDVYRPRVLYFALRKLRDRDAAEEVAQEAILITIIALREGRVRNEQGIGSYLFGIANNLVKQHFRQKGQKQRLHISADKVREVPWLEDPEAGVLLEEKRQQVEQAISSLEEADRVLLRQCYEDPIPLEELAEKLGISYAALRKRKSRALKRLKSSIQAVTKRPKLTRIK